MSSSISLTVLVEDSVSSPTLMAEHGLALWINTGAMRLLFDTGQSDLIIANAHKLSVAPDTVDLIALSHGHYDHCGGLAAVLANAPSAVPVYAHPAAFEPKYRRMESAVKDIGIPRPDLEAIRRRRETVRAVTTPTEIAPGLFLTGEIPRVHPEEQGGTGFCLDADGRQPDPFLDDQALFIKTSGGTIVILGCAHAGVINTLEYIRRLTGGESIRAVLGGMHLGSVSGERLAWTVDALRLFDIRFLAPMHCTGQQACAALWTAFPHNCVACGVGKMLEF